MKEYEYITYGIENYLVDELVGVICQESLESKPYPDGFRRIFDNYKLLRQKFKDKSDVLTIDDFKDKSDELGTSDIPESELGAIVDEFENDRSHFLESFLLEIESNYPDLGVRQISDDYFRKISFDDVETTEKRVCIYPYIISQVRQYDERKFKNGTHN